MRLKITVTPTYNGGRRKRKRDFKNRADCLYGLQSVSCCTYTWYIFFFFFCSLPFYFISIFFFVKVCKSTDRCYQYEATLLCFPYGETCSETNFYLTPLKKRMIWKKKKRNKEVGRPIFTIWYTYTKIGEEKRDKWII